MILTKVYSNLDETFTPIRFNKGLNIIMGEMRNPENMDVDDHNLGKSKLAELIDFCLLKGKSRTFFLFKHFDKFKKFTFFLEIEYKEGKYLTVKRSVNDSTKISFLKHSNIWQDFVSLPEDKWTHISLPFDKAKQTLDSYLDLEVINPWDYRMPVSYALRSQGDYKDVFQLRKFVRHINWKPYVAQLLGLDSALVTKQYELKAEYDIADSTVKRLQNELKDFTGSLDKLEGLILLKEDESGKLSEQLNNFDFQLADSQVNKKLVSKIDTQLSSLNKERYYVSSNIENIEVSLNKHKIMFNPKEAEELFLEAGILFKGQIKKTYDDLIVFNKEITAERRSYLKDELQTLKKQLQEIETKISRLNSERSQALYFLKDSSAIDKYKTLSNKLIKLEAETLNLKNQEQRLIEHNDAKSGKSRINSEIESNKTRIANNVKSTKAKDSKYSQIKLHFNSIIKNILDKEALISIEQNNEGNLEFKDEILDQSGNETSENDGNTYKKILCIAFDIAINQIYANDKYSHFIYHDGFLETLDSRKKYKFVELLRDVNQNNFQYIGTLIDSEIPNQDKNFFKANEVVLTLHDGENGTLFKGINF